MSLIVILLVMASENLWKNFQAVRPYQGVMDYAGWLQARWNGETWFSGPAGVLLAVAPGALVIALLQFVLGSAGGFMAWLVTFVFSAAVLIVSIGRRGADEQVEDYMRAMERGDMEGAWLHVRDLLPGQAPAHPGEMNRMLIEMLLVRNNERLLAILFWFVVLGPVGAVIYRSTTQLKGVSRAQRGFGEDFVEAVLRLQAVLDWIPARITALFYGLIGSFVDAMHQWRLAGPQWGEDLYSSNQGALINSGVGSLRLHEHTAVETGISDALRRDVNETLALINRTAIAWITGFALLTIAGWLS